MAASLDDPVEIEDPKFRDAEAKRHFCNYCSISKPTKYLIKAHMAAFHKEEIEKQVEEEKKSGKVDESKLKTCKECGATFRFCAHLKQHMTCHLLERPFSCPYENCSASFKWNNTLLCHLNKHEGKYIKCPVDGCNGQFTYMSSMKSHVAVFHGDVPRAPLTRGRKKSEKQRACTEPGCSKVFKYPSRLRKHQDSHARLFLTEAMCLEPGCMQLFSNDRCLKAHVHSCHRYIKCETCGSHLLRKCFRSHQRVHEPNRLPTTRVKCNYKDCSHTFSTKMNLWTHVRVVHLELKPYVCGFAGCGKRFGYKITRDNHEKSGLHVYTPGDFEVSDGQFRSRPRGTSKRICPTIDMLVRKRIKLPFPDLDGARCTPHDGNS